MCGPQLWEFGENGTPVARRLWDLHLHLESGATSDGDLRELKMGRIFTCVWKNVNKSYLSSGLRSLDQLAEEPQTGRRVAAFFEC